MSQFTNTGLVLGIRNKKYIDKEDKNADVAVSFKLYRLEQKMNIKHEEKMKKNAINIWLKRYKRKILIKKLKNDEIKRNEKYINKNNNTKTEKDKEEKHLEHKSEEKEAISNNIKVEPTFHSQPHQQIRQNNKKTHRYNVPSSSSSEEEDEINIEFERLRLGLTSEILKRRPLDEAKKVLLRYSTPESISFQEEPPVQRTAKGIQSTCIDAVGSQSIISDSELSIKPTIKLPDLPLYRNEFLSLDAEENTLTSKNKKFHRNIWSQSSSTLNSHLSRESDDIEAARTLLREPLPSMPISDSDSQHPFEFKEHTSSSDSQPYSPQFLKARKSMNQFIPSNSNSGSSTSDPKAIRKLANIETDTDSTPDSPRIKKLLEQTEANERSARSFYEPRPSDDLELSNSSASPIKIPDILSSESSPKAMNSSGGSTDRFNELVARANRLINQSVQSVNGAISLTSEIEFGKRALASTNPTSLHATDLDDNIEDRLLAEKYSTIDKELESIDRRISRTDSLLI